MLKRQVFLIAVLIVCVAFVSCDRTQKILKPAADEMMAAEEMMTTDEMMDMMDDMMMDMTAHKSWSHVMLPVPGALDAATNPAETGEVHGMGSRTVYINDIGVMANKEGTMYPAGTMIVKEIMDDADMFIAKVALMMKSDDPMYEGHNGWVYKKYARSGEDAEYMQVKGSNLEDAAMGCHGCHAKAENDSVFVSLSMDGDMDADMMGDDMMGDDMMDDGMMDADMMGDDMMADDMDADMMGDDMMADDMDADMMDDGMDADMDDGMMGDDMMDDDMMDDAGAGDAQ